MTHEWQPDILGPHYQRATIDLGEDPDGEGQIVATVVRYAGEVSHSGPGPCPAILYVHGMSDYFFHRHLAEHFARRGIQMYGVDLRKCGRSHREGQRWHDISDLVLYDDDLSSALAIVINDGPDYGAKRPAAPNPAFPPPARVAKDGSSPAPLRPVVIMAHSTGGLIVPGWLSRLSARGGRWSRLHSAVRALVLNSPWIDLQVSQQQQPWVRGATYALAALPFQVNLPQSDNDTYGRNLHSSYSGEWDYDLTFKPLLGQPKTFRWLRAILQAQDALHRGEVNADVPTLVLCSTSSPHFSAEPVDPRTSDVVLDVGQIQRRAHCVADDVTVRPIPGAIHDVFLSAPKAREAAISAVDEFLTDVGLG